MYRRSGRRGSNNKQPFLRSGVNRPVEYGGLGLDLKFNVAMNEELGNIDCGAIPMSIAVQTDMTTPALATYGSDRLKKEFLEPSIKGEYVSCLGVSEPGGGSDVAAITTNATRKGDDLIINGQKMWITNAFQGGISGFALRVDCRITLISN